MCTSNSVHRWNTYAIKWAYLILTYMVIICELEVDFGYGLVYMCNNMGSIWDVAMWHVQYNLICSEAYSSNVK